jgi:FixJ family two-component response regulator
MSGLELQRRLSHENRRIPVIFISGSCEDSVRDEALRIGATAFMTKPFADDELLSAVRSALG